MFRLVIQLIWLVAKLAMQLAYALGWLLGRLLSVLFLAIRHTVKKRSERASVRNTAGAGTGASPHGQASRSEHIFRQPPPNRSYPAHR